MSLNARHAGGSVLVVLLVTAPLAAAETVHYQEEFTGYVPGNLCTANPLEGWSCGATTTFEGVDVFLKLANEVLRIAAKSTGGDSTPNARHAMDSVPTANYKAQVRYTVETDKTGDGFFSVMRLLDASDDVIVSIGFKDADGLLDVSNTSASGGWDMDIYDPPSTGGCAENRFYVVDVYITGANNGKYDLNIYDGCGAPDQLKYTKTGIGWTATNVDGKVDEILLGSTSNADDALGHWDFLKFYTP